MEEIIKITERAGQSVVNARELHQFLENKREFTTWIKQRIEQYGFVENQDFTSFDNIVKRENGATVRKEYALTIDMAKELSMVENNERGRMARKYFIECEKKVKQQFQVPQTFAEALQLAADQQRKVEEQQKLLEEQKPKVKLAEVITTNEMCYPLKDLASILASKGVKIGPNRLRHFLKDNHYLGSRGACYNMPRHQYIEQGLFVVTEEPYTNQFGHTDISRTVLVTGKGLEYFINKLYKEENK